MFKRLDHMIEHPLFVMVVGGAVLAMLTAWLGLPSLSGNKQPPPDSPSNPGHVKLSFLVRPMGTGEKEWQSTLTVIDQTQLEWKIELDNGSSRSLHNVELRAAMSPVFEIERDSVRLYNANHEDGIPLDGKPVDSNGYDVGSYKSNSNVILSFQTNLSIAGNSETCRSTKRSFAFAGYDGRERETAFADVRLAESMCT